MKQKLLSIKAFAALAGLSRKTIYRRIEDKVIKTITYNVPTVGISPKELKKLNK